MKFKVDIVPDGPGYTATGIIGDREFEIFGSNLHSCLRSLSHLAESLDMQRVPKNMENYTPVVCHDH